MLVCRKQTNKNEPMNVHLLTFDQLNTKEYLSLKKMECVQDVNDCIVCVEIRYKSHVHFSGKFFLYSNANKNINI